VKVLQVVSRSRIVFPLACVAAAGMVFISEASYRRAVDRLDELGEVGAARTSIQSLSQSVLDAESSQRGYLLTSRKEYLQPYDLALRRINEAFQVLDRYYADQPEAVAQIHKLTEGKLSELAVTLDLFNQGKIDAANELVLSDIGKEKMEAIRALGAELLAHENRKVRVGRGDLYQTLQLSRAGVAALAVIGLLGLFMYLRQTAALERQQLELKRVVQEERDRLEVEVSERTAQLTELAQHLQTAREDERSRLARDLHDELGALLTSAKLDVARIKSRLGGMSPEALERIEHLVGTLNSGIAMKRRIVEDLRPSALSNLGLVATLEIVAREFSERSGLKVHCALAPVQLSATAELVVYRVVQEAITNLTKYARAQQVWLSLSSEGGTVSASVRDDGIGFDPQTRPPSTHGLVGMRYRVEAEGGTLKLSSAPGRGTSIEVTLPESSSPPA